MVRLEALARDRFDSHRVVRFGNAMGIDARSRAVVVMMMRRTAETGEFGLRLVECFRQRSLADDSGNATAKQGGQERTSVQGIGPSGGPSPGPQFGTMAH